MRVAMILAGGIGSRLGAGIPKQFIIVQGKPVLAYTAGIYQENEKIDAVEIVCHHSWIDYCWDMVDKYGLSKVRWIVPAGDTFQDSMLCGLAHLKKLVAEGVLKREDYIFFQYGAAPFTSQRIVSEVIRLTEEKGIAATATPCYQLIGTKDEDSTSRAWVDRDKVVQVNCPYGFHLGYVFDLYEKAEQEGLIETVDPHLTSLVYAMGDVIHLAYGDQTNIKLTTKEDLDLFEGYVILQKLRNGEKVSADERA